MRIKPVSNSDLKRMIDRLQGVIEKAAGSPLDGETAQQGDALSRRAAAGAEDLPARGEFASREVTILLADLRGFTAISEEHPATLIVGLLQDFLERMSEVVDRHGGAIGKFMGDSIMALFGAHRPRADDARRAVTCAVEMQIVVEAMNREIRQKGVPNLYLGIGISTGTVLAGVLGSKQFSEFTVIGRPVNLASRIEAFSLRGQVLVSQNTYQQCDHIETGEPMEVYVKGSSHPVTIREVLGVPQLGLKVPRQEVRRGQRVKVNIPFTYQIVRNKTVMPERLHGTILDIGYYGVLAEFQEDLDRYSEIRLELDLFLVAHVVTDIYARMVTSRVERGRCLAGMEFTSVGTETESHIRRFVQLLIQGSEAQ